ncbi:MAG: undecaprenyl-phosphate glucose phosphotransferase [Lachnospiraceae bacterium]|nr:undecaprenyl-phosphate glucose phosphotransferase [Lachnospiraceae bacterium]
MIKENQKVFNRMHVVVDAVVVYLAFAISYYLRFGTDWFDQMGYHRQFWQYQPMLLMLVPMYLILFSFFHMYQPKRYQARYIEYLNILKANVSGIGMILAYIFFTKTRDFPRSLLAIFFCVNVLLMVLERYVIMRILYRTRKKGRNLKHLILVGFSTAAAGYIDRIKANPQWGYYIHGIFDDQFQDDFLYRGVPIIGTIDELDHFLEENNLDEVAITLNIKEYEKLERIVAICEKSGTHTKFVPDYYKFISSSPYTEDLNGLPVINIRNVPLTNTTNKIVKRTMDIIGSLFAITLFSPIMLVTAILVKRSSPGPIIFCQERIGLHNKPFKMYKFRSMGVQPQNKEEKCWTTSNDPRVTSVGKVIRKTSIDELPQLFNVLKGDMSLIGPRPERPLFVEKFKEEIPRYMIKHQVRPGMTGWAQINGFRGDTSIRGRIEHDLYYIENWTLGLDIKILFLTFFKGFVNKNAY